MALISDTSLRRSLGYYVNFATDLEADILRVKQHIQTASSIELRDIFARRREFEDYYAKAAAKLSGRDLQVLEESYQRIQGLFQPKKESGDRENLLKLQQMLKAKQGTRKDFFLIFKALSDESQAKIYSLLCQKFGSPTGDVKADGIEHFLSDPFKLLGVLDESLPPLTPASSPAVSRQNEDLDGLLQLQKMLKSKSKYTVKQYFEVFKTLTDGTQGRIYELLCKKYGSPTNDIKKDGIDHFLSNPLLLAGVIDRVLPSSQSRPVARYVSPYTTAAKSKPVTRLTTKSVSVTRTNLPPPRQVHTDIVPHAREPWEKDVAPVSKEQICQSMDRLMRGWHINRTEALEIRLLSEDSDEKGETKEDRKKELRELDKQIFLHMKRNYGIETPMEFLWSLQNYRLKEPIRIVTRPETFVPDEGQFYKIDCFREECPLRVPGMQGDAVEGYDYFARAVKRTDNELYLYLDGYSQGGYLLINGQMYPCVGSGRGGSSKPSYRFKEGNVVCEGGVVSKYLFTVGKNGTILYPANERQGYEQETDQTTQFNEDNSRSQEMQLRFTTKEKYSGEIVEPFDPGFALYSGVQQTYQYTRQGNVTREELVATKRSESGDRIIIDITNDPILQSLIRYLTKEFEVMGYTDEQKMMRIAHLAADILSDEPSGTEMRYNYMLGEVLKAGCGVCRHRATLTKVLFDALLPDHPCVLVAGRVPKAVPSYFGKGGKFSGFIHMSGDASFVGARHAWNVVQIRGRNYIVDPMQECLFAADEPPGEKLDEYGENIGQKEMLDYYGAEHLGQNPFRLCIIEDDPVMREHAIQAARAKLEQGGYGRALKLEIEAPKTYAELQESLKKVDQGYFQFVLVDNDLSQYSDYQSGNITGMALVNEVIEKARAEQRYLGRNTTFYPNSSNNRHLRGGIFSNYNRVTDRKNGPMVFDFLGDIFERQARKRYSRFRPSQQHVDVLELPERPNSPRTE